MVFNAEIANFIGTRSEEDRTSSVIHAKDPIDSFAGTLNRPIKLGPRET
jgi:hypothetical protein